MYLDTIERFTCNLLPIMGLFFMLASVVSSLRPSSTVDVIEFATRSKLGFRGQSYVFVLYNAILPLLLLVNKSTLFSFLVPFLNNRRTRHAQLITNDSQQSD